MAAHSLLHDLKKLKRIHHEGHRRSLELQLRLSFYRGGSKDLICNMKKPSVRNVNDINTKRSPAIVAVKSTDTHLIYEATPLLPRCLFQSLRILPSRLPRESGSVRVKVS